MPNPSKSGETMVHWLEELALVQIELSFTNSGFLFMPIQRVLENVMKRAQAVQALDYYCNLYHVSSPLYMLFSSFVYQ